VDQRLKVTFAPEVALPPAEPHKPAKKSAPKSKGKKKK
jgi:hypothetical protein